MRDFILAKILISVSNSIHECQSMGKMRFRKSKFTVLIIKQISLPLFNFYFMFLLLISMANNVENVRKNITLLKIKLNYLINKASFAKLRPIQDEMKKVRS